jgi:hypothetical protein
MAAGRRLRVTKTDVKWRQGYQAFLLLVNMWTQVRSLCFIAKLVIST